MREPDAPHRWWRAHAVDALLAAAVIGATVAGIGADEAIVFSPPDAMIECLVLLTAAAAFFARRAPYAALAVATILDTVPYWLPIGGAGYHLGVLITLYCVVAHRPGRRALPAAGTVVILQIVLMAWDQDWRWFSMYVAIAALSDLFPVVLGLAIRSRAMAAEALEQRAVAAERSRDADAQKLLAEDRLRTARNLHDSVAHQIAVMNLNAGVASQSLRDRPDDAESALVTIREAGRGVISSISDLLTNLRDGQENDVDLLHDLADVQDLVEEFRRMSPTLNVSIQDRTSSRDLGVDDVFFHVVREALTNAYKHGDHDGPTHAVVTVDDASSHIRVTNAYAPGEPIASTGFGLTGMQERVAAVGGRVTVDRSPQTFTLDAYVPREEARP